MNFLLDQPVTANIETTLYKVTIQWRNGILIADEPATVGGQDLGPDPYTLFLSSLAACTLSTLRMYIDRKGWEIPSISINLNMYQTVDGTVTTHIVRNLQFDQTITEEQKERLLLIAKKCPISKILENNIIINTAI
ncbi:MAG: osmotically inducible protein OsmC [Flavobacterium sp. BFFFF2]|nr:MAG: osmotically inducible protein OsmC [Flavobacterium sp. BFFFF2]